MSQKVRAIVIKAEDRKDKDVSVLLFSIEEGKVWATLKGVKGEKSKLKAAKDPFSFGEFVLEDGKSGKIVVGFDRIENFHEIVEDINKFYESCAMLEVILRLDFSSDFERELVFMLLLRCLKALCFQKVRNLYVLNKFMIEIFRIYGMQVYSEKCTCCGSTTFIKPYFDFNDGKIVCVSCKNFFCEEFSRAVYAAMKLFTITEVGRVNSLKVPTGCELELLKLLARNFEYRFDCDLNFKGILS